MEDIIQNKLNEIRENEPADGQGGFKNTTEEPKQTESAMSQQKIADDKIRDQINKAAHIEEAPKVEENKNIDTSDKLKYGRERRRHRSTDGLTQKMHVSERFKKPDHLYRWFNDLPGRLAKAESMDWIFVNDQELSNEKAGGDARVKVLAGAGQTGEPYYAYLMEIPKEWHDDVQQAKMDKIREKEMLIEDGSASEFDGNDRKNTYGNEIKIQTRR